MSKVLLVDTNLASLPILEDMVREGHEVHVVGSNPTDTLAALLPHAYHQLDYSNTEQLQELFASKGFDALVPGCNDVSFAASCRIAGALRLPGYPDEDIANQLNNKKEFRMLAASLGLPIPSLIRFEDAVSQEDPLIVKPVDAFSGQGVKILAGASSDELVAACFAARGQSRSGEYIIENYVCGQLYSHSAYLVDRKISWDVFVQEHCITNQFAVDTSWVDNDIPNPVQSIVRSSIEKLSSSLELRDGLIHTQFISNGNDVWLIEPTLRCPGDLYCRLIDLSGWGNYIKNYWRPFMGLPLLPILGGQKESVVRHTVTFSDSASFVGLRFNEALSVKEFYPLSRTGSKHKAAPLDRAGIIFINCDGVEELRRVANAFLSRSALICESSLGEGYTGGST